MKAVFIGILIIVISGLNVYLPNVGNLFDEWRVWFAIVSFIIGWVTLVYGIIRVTNS